MSFFFYSSTDLLNYISLEALAVLGLLSPYMYLIVLSTNSLPTVWSLWALAVKPISVSLCKFLCDVMLCVCGGDFVMVKGVKESCSHSSSCVWPLCVCSTQWAVALCGRIIINHGWKIVFFPPVPPGHLTFPRLFLRDFFLLWYLNKR